jgi:stage V sporulation protein SpoVS
MTEFRVRKDTDTAKLAAAIFSNMKNMKQLELSCLGVGPVFQTIKAFIGAKALAVQAGIDLTIDPIYRNAIVDSDKEEKTLIIFVIGKKEEK